MKGICPKCRRELNLVSRPTDDGDVWLVGRHSVGLVMERGVYRAPRFGELERVQEVPCDGIGLEVEPL